MFNREKIIEDLLQNMHAMRHKLMVGYTVKKELAITPSQGFVLRLVAGDKTVNIRALAQKLNISSSAATQLVDGLVDKGYLLRKDDPNDRRVITLFLSAKAEKLFEKFKQQTLKQMMTLFDALTDEELIQFAALNKKMIDGIVNN